MGEDTAFTDRQVSSKHRSGCTLGPGLAQPRTLGFASSSEEGLVKHTAGRQGTLNTIQAPSWNKHVKTGPNLLAPRASTCKSLTMEEREAAVHLDGWKTLRRSSETVSQHDTGPYFPSRWRCGVHFQISESRHSLKPCSVSCLQPNWAWKRLQTAKEAPVIPAQAHPKSVTGMLRMP